MIIRIIKIIMFLLLVVIVPVSADVQSFLLYP